MPGEVGLNVSSLLLPSTAVHCDVDGHEIAVRPWPESIEVGVGVPGEVGLNVTSLPLPSIAVHCDVDGHEIPVRF